MRVEEGSTASTATLCPFWVRKLPSASIVVDLPTPGTPVMPIRTAPAGAWQERLDQLAGLAAMVRPARFDQRDRPGQRRAVAGEKAVGEGGDRSAGIGHEST